MSFVKIQKIHSYGRKSCPIFLVNIFLRT
jgi:hypothetical protein